MCVAIVDLASLVWTQVKCEPIVTEAVSATGTPAPVVDLTVWGVWMPHTEAFFDIKVTDTDTQSYSNTSSKEVLKSPKNEIKKKYLIACGEQRALFTPICCSVDRLFAMKLEPS